MKVIINFGEKKVVVPCGIDGNMSIRDLIKVATAKYCKLVSVLLRFIDRLKSNMIVIISQKRKAHMCIYVHQNSHVDFYFCFCLVIQ